MNDIVRTDFLLNKMCDTEDNPLIQSFMPCEHSALNRQYTTIFEFNYSKCAHRILETCKLQRIPYFTCIEYKADVECVERHVCDLFPVFIGMNLDRQIYEFLYGREELERSDVQRTMHDLYGTIYVVSPQYFSNIFTNRKEIVHQSKDMDKLYNIYMYDIYDRGHRIWLSNTSKTCIFRNSNGIEHDIEDSESFTKFMANIEYEVNIQKHIDFTRMYQVFVRFHTNNDIDDLTNKNILCCINLLQRGLKYAQRNPVEVCKIFRFGSLDKFASRNIAYHTNENKTNNKNSNTMVVSTTNNMFNMSNALGGSGGGGGGSGNSSSGGIDNNMIKVGGTKNTRNKKKIKVEKMQINDDYDRGDDDELKMNHVLLGGGNCGGISAVRKRPMVTVSQEEQQKSQMVSMMNSNSAGPASMSDYGNLAQNYKTLSPTNLVHSSDSYDRHIKRPVPKNVHTIPTGTEFFICLADTQLNVNSPHKWLRLLPHVIMTNHLNIKYCTDGGCFNNLNDILDHLCHKGLIETKYNMQANNNYPTADDDDILILVNGGIPTRYHLAKTTATTTATANITKNFFFYCKSICPFVECVIADNYIILSLTYGVPMRPVSIDIINELRRDGDNNNNNNNIDFKNNCLYLSPLDMKNTFLQPLRQFLYGHLLGGGCPDNMRKYFKYSIPAKVHSVYTFNNRFISNVTAMPYYDLTCENSFIFINNVYKLDKTSGGGSSSSRIELLDKKNSIINLKTIYSSDPHLTCDGYILSDKIKMDTLMKQKCRFEFELHTKTDTLIWSKDLPSFGNTSNGQIRVYDAYNNCIKTYYRIFTLVRYSKSCLRYKLFNQAKISLFCYPFSDGWIYYLYKYYDEEAFILPGADYEMSVIFTTPIDRKFIKNTSIMICTACKQPERFSGQKIYEICGQKGLCIQQSTERFQKYYNLPEEPDLVVSLFSAIGRTPIMTLKTMVDNLTPAENQLKSKILYGNCEYVLLKNISSLFCSYGNMRVDISLVKIFLANNLNLTIYLLQQDEKNNGRVLPKSFCKSLGFYGLIKVNFVMYDEFGKEYDVFVNTFKQKTL